MADLEFKVFGEVCELGEGPLWHPTRERLFWFDIPAGRLFASNAEGEQQRSWHLGEAASAAGWIDLDTLLVATASGLQKFDLLLGSWETLVKLEEDNAVTRSNDGRTAPDGSFWIGTTGRNLEKDAGAYYRYHQGKLKQIIQGVTVPNATCFSPDGKWAYLSDTLVRLIWRWRLDESGVPMGEKEIFIDLRAEQANPDGAVVDAEGFLWNAHWGGWKIVRYDPDGNKEREIAVPVSQPTCPAFGGHDLNRLYITSARQGLSEMELAKQPHAGKVLALDIDIAGQAEFPVKV